jgi:superfamily I DNA/RNA helicase
MGEEVSYESEDSEYYSLVVQETLSKLKGKELKYDAILVDEGQDFSDDMYRVITSILNPKTNNLTIALDDHQTLYEHSQTWKDLGIQVQGRVHRISHVYRNTNEIAEFAAKFIGEKEVEPKEEQQGLFPDIYGFNGPKPEMKQFKSIEEMITYVASNIKKLADSKECPFSEIAIIYAVKTPWNMPDTHLPQMLEKALEARGFLYKWASEDYRSKRSYDVTTNSVTISTIHSVKGLDYSCVFLVGLDFIGPKITALDQTKNLVYVGITRARYRLFIPYVNKNELITDLLNCM